LNSNLTRLAQADWPTWDRAVAWRNILLGLIVLGLLAFKPHLGLILPLALVLAARWKTTASATATVLLAAGASVALFGADTWQAFLAD
jgi:hypothetical protein